VSSIRDDRGRLRMHVLTSIGTLDVRTFGRDDVDAGSQAHGATPDHVFAGSWGHPARATWSE
jgi:hypothetical protein